MKIARKFKATKQVAFFVMPALGGSWNQYRYWKSNLSRAVKYENPVQSCQRHSGAKAEIERGFLLGQFSQTMSFTSRPKASGTWSQSQVGTSNQELVSGPKSSANGLCLSGPRPAMRRKGLSRNHRTGGVR